MASEFKLLEKLGEGAMGTVYKAEDIHLERFVAIKVLKPELAYEESLVKRFKREAALAARLNHPNIVTLYGIEPVDKSYRIIMEYVEGVSLARLLSRTGRQEPRYAIELIRQVADALTEAHTKDVIHRDIKPHNIMLGNDGRVKVADFGLARAFREGSDMTHHTSRLGTPRYMSPEQANAAPLTFHTDLYSLGVVLYELLAGKPAYDEADPLVLMRRITDEPFPDIRRVLEKVNPSIAKIIAKLTAKNVFDRYPSAAKLSADLSAFLKRGIAPLAEVVKLPSEDEPVYNSATVSGTASYLVKDDETDFLLHYVFSDETWAEWISAQLKGAGYKVELHAWDFKKSHQSMRQLIKAGTKSTCVVSVVSPAYLKALHNDRDWSQEFSKGELNTLPIVVTKCFVGSTFKTVDYLDFCELGIEEAKGALLDEAIEQRGLPSGNVGKALEHMLDHRATAKLQYAVYRVPVPLHEHFAGRSKLLSTMHQRLTERGGIVTLTQTHRSDTGMGLTQLAAQFAHINRANYSLVWMIRAHRQETLLCDYTQIAEEIGLPERTEVKLSAKAKGVKHWLANNRGWLLIFDGARSAEYIATLLPRRLSGHVIITSSDPNWPSTTNPLPLTSLKRSESVQFISNRTQQYDEGAAAALAESLADAPLALNLATAYISAARLTLDQYIELFLDRHKAIWGFHDPPKNSSAVVLTAFSLTAERIAVESPGALGLMKVCAYVGQHRIPLSRLTSSAKLFPSSLARVLQNTSQLRDALAVLRAYQAVDECDDDLSMHHALQQLMFTWMEQDYKEEPNELLRKLVYGIQASRGERRSRTVWLASVMRFLLEALPEDPRLQNQWREFERLYPHIRIVTKHAERLNLHPLEQADLWYRTARYHLGRLDHERALRAHTEAVKLRTEAHGEKHEDVSVLYKEMAHVHRAQGDLQRARVAYETALAIDEKLHRRAHKSVATGNFNLGNVSMELGDHARARQFYTKALELDTKLEGKASSDAGRDMTYLGLVSQELGDYTAAWGHYRQALEVCENVFGESHERVAAATKNLAGLMQKMGDLSNAKELFRRAIEIDTALHGEQHPDVAQDYNNLGITEEGLGMQDQALEHYKKALAINQPVYGDDHAKVAINRNNIANIKRSQGKLDEAEKYYEAALKVFRKSLGENHDTTRTAVHNLRRITIQKGGGTTG